MKAEEQYQYHHLLKRQIANGRPMLFMNIFQTLWKRSCKKLEADAISWEEGITFDREPGLDTANVGMPDRAILGNSSILRKLLIKGSFLFVACWEVWVMAKIGGAFLDAHGKLIAEYRSMLPGDLVNVGAASDVPRDFLWPEFWMFKINICRKGKQMMRNYTIQMDAARRGVLPPEMIAVAKKEYQTEEIRELAA